MSQLVSIRLICAVIFGVSLVDVDGQQLGGAHVCELSKMRYDYYTTETFTCGLQWGWRKCTRTKKKSAYREVKVSVCCQNWQPVRKGDNDCSVPVCPEGCQNGGSCYSAGKCHCLPGFSEPKCMDVNECVGNHGCGDRCKNTHGSYICECDEGYGLLPDKKTCTPVCFGGCPNGGLCYAPGICRCQPGFAAPKCVDIDECSSQLDGCSDLCLNKPGSFECECFEGSALVHDNKTCKPTCYGIQPPGTCYNGHACIGTDICDCSLGFALSTCTDIDECGEVGKVCDHQEKCVNSIGSYTCGCRDGYILNEDGQICQPVCYGIEPPGVCLHGNVCDKPDQCNCRPGFGHDLCEDLDECTVDNGGCQHGCSNTVGSFFCSCENGYQLLEDGMTCTATCFEIKPPGFCLHDNICERPNHCVCKVGFDQLSCEDTDECLIGNGGCKHECVNTLGSFRCECSFGFRLLPDQATCEPSCVEDLKPGECLNGGICTSPGTCSCKPGFDPRRFCAEMNCYHENGGCSHYCVKDEKGSYCECPSGYGLYSDKLCVEIDECVEKIAGCGQLCENTPGSFKCLCNDNSILQTDGKTCKEIVFCKSWKDTTKDCQPLCKGEDPYCYCGIGTHLHTDGKHCVDPCIISPCKNKGVCFPRWTKGYRCNCRNTGFSGDHCESGVIIMPSTIEARVGEPYGRIQIQAKPPQEIVFNVIEEVPSISVIPNPIIVRGPTDFAIVPNKRGIYDITFNITGSDSASFDDFKSLSVKANDVFSRLKLEKRVLPTGCFWVSIKFREHNLWFTSTSYWLQLHTSPVIYTTGIVMLVYGTLSLPISKDGVEIKSGTHLVFKPVESTDDDGMKLENHKNVKCDVLHLSSRDMDEFRKARSVLRSLFNSLKEVVPYWLSIFPTENDAVEPIPFTPQIIMGHALRKFTLCSNAPINDDVLYLVFKFMDPITIKALEETMELDIGEYCFMVDMLSDKGTTLNFMFSDEAAIKFEHMYLFESLEGALALSVNFTGFSVSLPGHIPVPKYPSALSFWNGVNVFEYPFGDTANFWTNMKIAYSHSVGRIDYSINSRIETYLAGADPNKVLTHLMVEARDVLLNVREIEIDVGFDIFGKKVHVTLLDNFEERRAVAAFGGMANRTYCGPTANPPGLFALISMDIKLFEGMPIIEDLFLNVNTGSYVFKTFPEVDAQNLFWNEESGHTRQILNNLTDAALELASLITQREVWQDEAEWATELLETIVWRMHNITSCITELNRFPYAALRFADFSKEASLHSTKVEHIILHLKDLLSLTFDKSLNDIVFALEEQFKQLSSCMTAALEELYAATLTLFPNSGTMGIKGKFSMKLLGIHFGIEGELVYSDEDIMPCHTQFEYFYSHLEGEEGLRGMGVVYRQKFAGYTLKWGPLVWRYFTPDTGAGLGLAFARNSFKFVVRIIVRWSVLGLSASGDLYITSKGVYASVEANVWNMFRTRLTVGTDLSANIDDWALWVKGEFLPGGDDHFEGSLWDAIRQQIASAGKNAKKRMEIIEKALSESQEKISAAQQKVDAAKKDLLSREGAFDTAIEKLEKANSRLEAAKAPFRKASQSLTNLRNKLMKMCQIKTCDKICFPGRKICTFKINRPICVIKNIACTIARGVIYIALEAAKAFVYIPLLALDAAKATVSISQILVDNSRWLLKLAAGLHDFANLVLEGVQLLAYAAEKTVSGLKIVLDMAFKMFNALAGTLQKFIDFKLCGFKIELSIKSWFELHMYCEMNIMSMGWKKYEFVFNFRNVVSSLWSVGKNTLSKAKERGTRRQRRDIEFDISANLHNNIRHRRSINHATNDSNGTTSQTWTGNESSEARTYGFEDFLGQRCEDYTSVTSFLEESLLVLQNISSEIYKQTADLTNDISNDSDEFNFDSYKIYPDITDIPADIYLDLNLTNDQISKALTTVNRNEDPLVQEAIAALEDLKKLHMESTDSIHQSDIVLQWKAHMVNITTDRFSNDQCFDFSDCIVWAFGELHHLYSSIEPGLITNSRNQLSDFEADFYDLLNNESQTAEHLVAIASGLLADMMVADVGHILCAVAPEIIIEPIPAKIQVGKVATFVCEARGFPLPMYYWYKDDKFLIHGTNATTLELKNVSEANEGFYRCDAGNHIGNTSSSCVYLDVVFPPIIVSTFPRLVESLLHRPSCLQCNASADPSPSIRWYSSHQNQSVASNGTLLLGKEMYEALLFKCVASNVYGTTASAEIVISTKRGRPSCPAYGFVLAYFTKQLLDRTLANETTESDLSLAFFVELTSIVKQFNQATRIVINSFDENTRLMDFTVTANCSEYSTCSSNGCNQDYEILSSQLAKDVEYLMKEVALENPLFTSNDTVYFFNTAYLEISKEMQNCPTGYQKINKYTCVNSTSSQPNLDAPTNLTLTTLDGKRILTWTPPSYAAHFVKGYTVRLVDGLKGTTVSINITSESATYELDDAAPIAVLDVGIRALTTFHLSQEAVIHVDLRYHGLCCNSLTTYTVRELKSEALTSAMKTAVVVSLSLTVAIAAIGITGAVVYKIKRSKLVSADSTGKVNPLSELNNQCEKRHQPRTGWLLGKRGEFVQWLSGPRASICDEKSTHM